MEYNQELVEETISNQIDLIRAKIEAVENNIYKISQPINLVGFETLKKNFSTIQVDWDASDSAPQYDRVFYCFLMEMIHWLDIRLDIMGLLEEAEVQKQFESLENQITEIEMMLSLNATVVDNDPIGTVLNKGYEESLEQENDDIEF